MDKEIKDYQDKMIGFVIEAKELQTRSGYIVGLSMEGNNLAPVDAILKSLYSMSERDDLKRRIETVLLTNPNNK